MKDLDIIKQLMSGNHLEPSEVERAKEIVERLIINVNNRRKGWVVSGKKIWHLVIEGHHEEQMRALFEEIQNEYRVYDNCVLEEHHPEDTIIDAERYEETGMIKIDKEIVMRGVWWCPRCQDFFRKEHECFKKISDYRK